MKSDWILFAISLGAINGLFINLFNVEGTLYWLIVISVAIVGNALYGIIDYKKENENN